MSSGSDDGVPPYTANVKPTNVPAIKNGPLVALAEGSGWFSNYHLAALILSVPWLVKRLLPIVNRGGFYTYWTLVVLLGVPVAIGYWAITSNYGTRKNKNVHLPGKSVDDYISIRDVQLRRHYGGDAKIPMQVFHDAYFDGQIEFKGDVLEILEQRHDWATFNLTPKLFEYVLTRLIPEVIVHSQSQDEEQVRDHYDRGDDFYQWFLGPSMIYTSGVVRDITREETLEELQTNKVKLVCEKLELKPEDNLLDVGCGWGSLVAFATTNYGCKATGITLGKNQTAWGNGRLQSLGQSERGKILCLDYRQIPGGPGSYTKIVSLEMAEHVGLRRYGAFLRQLYDLLADDGLFVLQVAGIRGPWQFEDLVWGLFMNKYVFPGADASCSLGWVMRAVEDAGFEVKTVDVLGVHYSATLWRWYKNWLHNKDAVEAQYGERWFRIWAFFLAYSVIISRQGSASVFQITLHKNLNAYHRILGVPSHASIHVNPQREFRAVW